MKRSLLYLITSFVIVLSPLSFFAQCNEGEAEIFLDISVDGWGQETYWELVPVGNDCGTGTIAWGSNDNVGCAGTDPATTGEGYPDNQIITEGPYCLTIGESYDLIYVDSYGDGGLQFLVITDGAPTHQFVGSGSGNTWTIVVGDSNFAAGEFPCNAVEIIPDGAIVTLDNTDANVSIGEPTPPGGACGAAGYWCETGLSNTLWAYFIAAEGVTYEISTCNAAGSFDTQLAVYHASDCGDFSTFELVGANDDKFGGCGATNVYASTCWASCLIPGDTYYIQLDGWNGATGEANLSVTTYTGANALYENLNDVQCPVDKGVVSTGSIRPFLTGEGSNFTCDWTGPNGYTSTESEITGLNPGVYNLTLTTPCGEVFNETYEIFQPAPWNVVINSTGPDCEESANGSISLTVNGATSPYGYSWFAPNFNSALEDLTGLGPNTYNLTITDDNGCQYVNTIGLLALNEFSFDLGNDTTICQNQTLLVFAPAGLTYAWQDGSNNQFYQINAGDWGLGSNALVLTATTDLGCSYTDAFIFNVDNCIAVEEIQANLEINLYPNPARERIQLVSDVRMQDACVRVLNGMGQVVLQTEHVQGMQYELMLPVSAGSYIIEVIDGDRMWRETLVKQ